MQAGNNMAISGVETVEGLRDILNSIHQAIETVSGMNFQIASATEEQSVVADDISANVVAIADSGRTTVEQVRLADAECTAMLEQVEKLHSLVNQFKV